MNKLMNWLTNSFAPGCQKVFANPWIDSVASTMKKVLPFILTGSLISFYNVFRSYLTFLPDLSIVFNFTFGLLAVYIVFLVTHEAMVKLGHGQYKIYASLTAVGLLLLFSNATIDNEMFMVENVRIGASDIMLGLITGLLTALVFHLYAKLNLMKNNDSIPDFVTEWINNIIPITITFIVGMLIRDVLHFDLYNALVWIFSPLQWGAQTLPGFILICLVPAVFYSLGISSWVFNAVTTPIFLVAIAENIAAVAGGGAAVNIATSETVFTAALITMGGVGATLPLNVMMLRSKCKKLNVMGKICIAPSIFNINEPLMFGAPVVFNPMLMLPMWINTILGSAIVWLAMHFSLLNIPSKMIQVGQIPAPFSSVMITQDWRAIPLYVVLFAIYFTVWLPFFKVYEKECIMEEANEAAENEEYETSSDAAGIAEA